MSVSALRMLGFAALFAAISGGAPQLKAQEPIHYSRKQLRTLIKKAKTAEDYRRIAAYLRIEHDLLQARAQAEFQEYARCARYVVPSAKTPNRADLTSDLFSYYDFKSQDAAKAAEIYEREAERAAITDGMPE